VPIRLHISTMKGDVLVSPYLVKSTGEMISLVVNPKNGCNKYFYSGSQVLDQDGICVASIGNKNAELEQDYSSIWDRVMEYVDVNDSCEIVARGMTIFGEEHAILLVPVLPE
jgi:hypothetical protein